jgi:RNA binding exosome subunit
VEVVSARISAIVHATEDPEKVINALSQTCSIQPFQSKLDRRELKGHYGNEISTLRLSLRSPSAGLFFINLWRMLPSLDRETLLNDLDTRLDADGRLHLRLDKEQCFRGVLRLKDQDPIKVEVSFRKALEHGLRLAEEVRQFLHASQDHTKSLADTDVG